MSTRSTSLPKTELSICRTTSASSVTRRDAIHPSIGDTPEKEESPHNKEHDPCGGPKLGKLKEICGSTTSWNSMASLQSKPSAIWETTIPIISQQPPGKRLLKKNWWTKWCNQLSSSAGDWTGWGSRVRVSKKWQLGTSISPVGQSLLTGKVPKWTQLEFLGYCIGVYICRSTCAQTMLCYEWWPMGNEEWGQGLWVMNSKKGAYHRAHSTKWKWKIRTAQHSC